MTAEVLAIWVGYASVGLLAAWGVSRVTQRATSWSRRLLISIVLAAFFAPSVVGGGHGGGIGPAWMALFQMFPIKLGVAPIVVTAAAFFLIGSIVSRVGVSKEQNE